MLASLQATSRSPPPSAMPHVSPFNPPDYGLSSWSPKRQSMADAAPAPRAAPALLWEEPERISVPQDLAAAGGCSSPSLQDRLVEALPAVLHQLCGLLLPVTSRHGGCSAPSAAACSEVSLNYFMEHSLKCLGS